MAEASCETAAGRSVRILLIDDDAALVRMARLVLQISGFSVVTAMDGLEGLGRLEGEGFDLIVLDLTMPRMDGRSFYREMRARGHVEPVLILSAFEARAARDELRAEGAMAKPFDPDDLVREVQRLIGRDQEPDEPLAAHRT